MILQSHIWKWTALIIIILLTEELSGQWLQGYAYREKITINGDNVYGSVDLLDFPLLVSLSQSNLRSVYYRGLVFSDDGWDIRFTSDDGTTLLDHDLELYTASSGELVAWVRIPSLSYAEDSEIYLYYGNPDADSDPSKSTTWSTDFQGIWHLGENVNDASQFSNNGVNNGAVSVAGKIGNGLKFFTLFQLPDLTEACPGEHKR